MAAKVDDGSLTIVYMPLEELVHLPRNPKDHDLGSLHESIDRHGFVDPHLRNSRTGHVLGGNGRLIALRQKKAAGEKAPRGVQVKGEGWLVPVVPVDVPEEEEEALALALNELTIAGGYRQDILAQVLSDIVAKDPTGESLKGTGFDRDRVDAVLAFWRKQQAESEKGEDEGIEYTPESFTGAADEWVDARWRIPAGALMVVEEQVDRVAGLLGLGQKARGLALERMAILTATVTDVEIMGDE